MASALTSQDPGDLITDALGDLGSLVRQHQAGTLSHEGFYDLINRMRTKLKAARIACGEPGELELTDLGAAIGRLIDAGVVTPASQLLPGVNRARTYGHLAVIDGDLSAIPADPTQQGA